MISDAQLLKLRYGYAGIVETTDNLGISKTDLYDLVDVWRRGRLREMQIKLGAMQALIERMQRLDVDRTNEGKQCD